MSDETDRGGIERQRAEFFRIERRRMARGLLVPSFALLGVVGVVAFLQPKFLSLRAVTSVGVDAAPMLMMAMGAMMAILIGGIDLSIATMASFSAVTVVILSPTLGDFAVPASLLLAAAIGAAQGLVHVKAQIPSFVVSFGTFGMLYGVTHFITNATAAPLAGASLVFDFLAGRTGGFPNGLFVVLLFALLLSLLFRFTRLGRDLYATGSSERAALIAGVKITRLKMSAFAISAVCAAVGGMLLLAQTRYSSPAMANSYLLPAIVGVVVGGTAISGGIGGIGPTVLGGLIVVVVRVGTVLVGMNPAVQDIVFGLVILVAVALTIDREKIGIIK